MTLSILLPLHTRYIIRLSRDTDTRTILTRQRDATVQDPARVGLPVCEGGRDRRGHTALTPDKGQNPERLSHPAYRPYQDARGRPGLHHRPAGECRASILNTLARLRPSPSSLSIPVAGLEAWSSFAAWHPRPVCDFPSVAPLIVLRRIDRIAASIGPLDGTPQPSIDRSSRPHNGPRPPPAVDHARQCLLSPASPLRPPLRR